MAVWMAARGTSWQLLGLTHHTIENEFLLLRSLPVAPFRLLFYASLSACFDGIQFSVFDLDYASSSSIVPNEDGQPPCAVLEDALASSCSGWQIG